MGWRWPLGREVGRTRMGWKGYWEGKKKEEWVGLRKQSNKLGGKGKCFLFSKPFINCKLF
jgi:hypothetical protein